MDWDGVSTFILALVGVGGLVSGWFLNRRGQRTQEYQADAAAKLSERAQAFDEVERLNDDLREENERLRKVIAETEATGERRLGAQAQRCRNRLDDMTAALAALRSVVLSEVVQASADDALEAAVDHVATDHPDTNDAA